MKKYIILVLSLSLLAGGTAYAEKKFVVSTIPKTGTHFIQKFLENLTGKKASFANPSMLGWYFYVWDQEMFNQLVGCDDSIPIHFFSSPLPWASISVKLDELDSQGRFLSAHAPFSQQYQDLLVEKDYIIFFVVRDPRDYTISLTKHLRKFGSDMFPKWCCSLSFGEQLFYAIQGTDWYNGARYVHDVFLPWRDSSNTCTLQFEKLIGPVKGDCTPQEHLQELRKIADALRISCNDEILLQAFDDAFGTGYTYSPSRVGGWREAYEELHKEVFKDHMGDWLIELGYEENEAW